MSVTRTTTAPVDQAGGMYPVLPAGKKRQTKTLEQLVQEAVGHP